MKKIFSILFVSIFALALILLAGYGYFQYRNQKVNHVVIHIQRRGEKGFIDKKKLLASLQKQDSIPGKMIKSIDISLIKSKIARNPYVKAVDLFFNLSGDLMVNIRERTPLLRIYNEQNKSGYIDGDGNLFPVSNSFAPRVLPANGYIKAKLMMGENIHDGTYKNTALPGLYLLAKKIAANPFLKANISQLFINSKGDIDMAPELGRFIFHLGGTADMDIKLENLEAFCKKILAHGAWSKYRSINLQYTNQIVCTKK